MKKPSLHFPITFWGKSVLSLVVPGGWGYSRQLKSKKDPTYIHERDKHPVRHKHHGGGGWESEEKGTFQKRAYDSYDEYVTHQRIKFDEIMKIRGGFSNKEIFLYRLKFYSRFKHLMGRLPKDARIVCCGARQGTEVEVLRDLGFRNAIGIDLNPGPGNPLVQTGDMLHMNYPDHSVDLIYTNCVDHAFSLNDLVTEHVRVLKSNGYLLYDISINAEGEAGAFEAISWPRSEDVILLLLQKFEQLVYFAREKNWMWTLVQGKRNPN